MSSEILSCRCRHCGQNFPYLRENAGAEAECPECHNNVMLPGRLRGVAAKRRARVNTRAGVLMELTGFLLVMWWPIGTIAGIALIFFGWRRNSAWRCTGCEAATSKTSTRCGSCGAAFASE